MENEILLTQNQFIDIQILVKLDDKDLENLCSLNNYLKILSELNEFWTEKIIFRFNEKILFTKPPDISLEKFYDYLANISLSIQGMDVCAKDGNLEMIKWMFKKGIKPNKRTATYASSKSHICILDWLETQNILPSGWDVYDAKQNGREEVVSWCLKRNILPRVPKSFVIGNNAIAMGYNAVATGRYNEVATGRYNIAIGAGAM